jgi:hypothetical protein
MIIFNRIELHCSERLQDGRGARALQREQRVVGAAVGDGHGELRDLPADPREVLVDVAGVDAKEKILRAAHVNEQVVHDAAVRVAHRGVKHTAGKKPGDVVRDEVIQKLRRVRPAHIDFAHVAHVEQAGGAPHREVLGEDALVLHRHFPAGKIHDASAVRHVEGMQWGAFRFTHAADCGGGTSAGKDDLMTFRITSRSVFGIWYLVSAANTEPSALDSQPTAPTRFPASACHQLPNTNYKLPSAFVVRKSPHTLTLRGCSGSSLPRSSPSLFQRPARFSRR